MNEKAKSDRLRRTAKVAKKRPMKLDLVTFLQLSVEWGDSLVIKAEAAMDHVAGNTNDCTSYLLSAHKAIIEANKVLGHEQFEAFVLKRLGEEQLAEKAARRAEGTESISQQSQEKFEQFVVNEIGNDESSSSSSE